MPETGSNLMEANKSECTLVRLQFFDCSFSNSVKDLRAVFRRGYKLGDKIEIRDFRWENTSPSLQSTWTEPRIVVDFNSVEDVSNHVIVRHRQYWNMQQCQAWKNHVYRKSNTNRVEKTEKSKKSERKAERSGDDCGYHGSGLAKRFQAQIVAKFLLHATMFKLSQLEENYWPDDILLGPHEWKEVFDDENHQGLKRKAVDFLNSGTGVIDVAGGSGHVSMALGMEGIKSTVVDSRFAVGKLPGRDRKIWNKALKSRKNSTRVAGVNYCQVIPFDSHRAWFGSRPEGVDKSFRHPDEDEINLCDNNSELLKNASAIIALHPDEATGDVVHIATEKRLPFVVVPCCVFCRLFPQRRKSDDKVVSSYSDLLEYLVNIDSSIRQSELPFEGKNKVLWSTF